MKKIMFAVAVIAVFTVFPNNPTTSHAEEMDLCNAVADISRSIMTARQSGAPARDVMEIMKKNFTDEKFQEFVIDLVEAAYNSPRYSTEGMKEKAIVEFENELYMYCVKTTR